MLYVLVVIWIDTMANRGLDFRPVTGRAVSQAQCKADLQAWQIGHHGLMAACQPEGYVRDML